jgi:EAL domain-containing protein (putative c-di-GMP-specific phosphodiesterase class I)
MHERASTCAAITADLREALEQGRLSLHYQPIVDLADGTLAGAEALLRWQREDGSYVPPDVFVPVAEAAGLMQEVDAWVLDQACRDLATWRALGADISHVNVNVSRLHLTRALPGMVARVLDRHGLQGADLCLEVTESAVAPDPELADEVLRAVRVTGVRVALDDFGTGQSSLSQLADLPVDVVKIDKSFVARAQHEDGRLLLRSVLSLCRALGLRVVVEGVEDITTLPALRSDGCDLAQGDALGRPAPAADLVERARGWTPADSPWAPSVA